jgi:predicted ATPase
MFDPANTKSTGHQLSLQIANSGSRNSEGERRTNRNHVNNDHCSLNQAIQVVSTRNMNGGLFLSARADYNTAAMAGSTADTLVSRPKCETARSFP